MCICVGCVHMNVDACRGQKRVSDTLELDLQMVVSYLTQVLGTEFGCFYKSINTPNC